MTIPEPTWSINIQDAFVLCYTISKSRQKTGLAGKNLYLILCWKKHPHQRRRSRRRPIRNKLIQILIRRLLTNWMEFLLWNRPPTPPPLVVGDCKEDVTRRCLPWTISFSPFLWLHVKQEQKKGDENSPIHSLSSVPANTEFPYHTSMAA